MSRKVKLIGLLTALCLAVSISLLAYAKTGRDAAGATNIAQQGTQVVSTSVGNTDNEKIASDQSQVNPDDEKISAEQENEREFSESEEAKAGDPVEAPGTPGYEEGNFDGQHEF